MSLVRLLCKPLIVLLKTIRDVIGPVMEHGVTVPLPGNFKISISMDFLVILMVSLETAIIIFRQDPKISHIDRGLTFVIHRVLQWILVGIFKTAWGWIDTVAIASMVADTQTPFLNLMFIRLMYCFKFFSSSDAGSGLFSFLDPNGVAAKLLSGLQVLSTTILRSIHGVIHVAFLVLLSLCLFSGFILRSVGLNAVYERRCALTVSEIGEVSDIAPLQHCPYPTTNLRVSCPSTAQCLSRPVLTGNNYCDWGSASTKVLQAFFLDGFLSSASEMETASDGAVLVFWVASIVFGSFMLLNLLVSVVVSEYSSTNFANKRAKDEAAANAEEPPKKAVAIKNDNEEEEEEEEESGYKVSDYNDDFDLAQFAFSQDGFAGCGACLSAIQIFSTVMNAIQSSCWSVLACLCPKCCDPASIEKDVTKKWYFTGYNRFCKFSARLLFWKFTLVPNDLILKLYDNDVKLLDSLLSILFPRSIFPRSEAVLSRFFPVTFSSLWIHWDTFNDPDALPLCMQPRCQASDRQQHMVDWLNELELPTYSGWDSVTAFFSLLHLCSLACSYNGMCHFIYQVEPGSSISLSSVDVQQCSRAMILNAINILWLVIVIFRLIVLWCAHRSVVCFIRRRWNYFEVVVSLIVCVGLFVSDVIGLSQTSPTLWFFKLMRCGSIFWVLKVTPVPKIFARAFGDPFGMVSAMMIVIFLNFVMAIFGRELFKRTIFLQSPNFGSLSGAFSVTMVILLGEKFDSYSATALSQRFGIAGYLFFVFWHFLMVLTFLKLFVAIIVDNMSLSPEQRLAGQKLLLENDLRKVVGQEHSKWGAFDLADAKSADASHDGRELESIRRKSITTAFSRGQINSSIYSPPDENAKSVPFDQDVIPLSIMANFSFIHQRDLLQGEGSNIPIEILMKKTQDDLDASKQRIRTIKVAPMSELASITRNSLSSIKPAPLGAVSASSDLPPPVGLKKRLLLVRQALRSFTESSLFDIILTLVVIFSTILCVINTPASQPVPPSIIDQLDLFFLVIFALEAFIKICIQGDHPFDVENNGYFCQALNWFDFFILIFQILDFVETSSGALFNRVESANWIAGVRGLRAIRLIPKLTRLRIGTYENPFKFAVNTIKMSASEILLVMFVLLSISSLFSLFGMSLFSGLFYECIGDGKVHSQLCFGPVLYENPVLPGPKYLIPLAWKPTSGLHFDDFGAGILTMVKLLNKGGISGLITLSTSVTQWGSAPLVDSSVGNAAFVIVFQLFCGVLMSQMIVGTLTNNLCLSTGAGLLTEAQQRWKATRMMIEDELQAPKKIEVIDPSEKEPGCDRVIAMMTGAVLSSTFDNMCAAVVVFNYVLIAMRACSNDYQLILTTHVLLYVCIYFYLAEFVIRATCVFISNMPKDDQDKKNWLWCSTYLFMFLRAMFNEFWVDIIGIIAVFSDVIVEQLYGIHIGCSTLCLIRLHRVLSRNRTIMNYWASLKKSFPVTLSLCLIIFIWIFLFAVLGSKLFAEVKTGRFVDFVNNFSTFPKACRFLFFLGLGESWSEVIDELAVAYPACTVGLNTDCGPNGALLFLLIFILGMNFFLIPMFSSVVITFYSEAMTLSKSNVSFDDCEKFRDYFIKYSVGQMTLPLTQLRGLMEKLQSVRCKISVAPGKEGKDHNGRPFKNNRGYSKFEEHVIALSRREGEEQVIHWKQLARLAVSHRFTPEAVTVVDIKLKELALDAIKGIGQRPSGDVEIPLTLDAQFRENVMEKTRGGSAELAAVIGNRMDPSVFELTLMGIEENLPQAAGGPVNQKVKIRNPDEYSNYKVKKAPSSDDATPAQKEILDLKYDIEKKTTLMKDMVTDNLLTNQEAFVVLQHWELHILRRKYEAAQNASQSPVPGAKNIDMKDFTDQGVHMWCPSENLSKLQSGGQVDGWTILKSRHKFDALELVDKLWTHFDNNSDPKEDKIINPSYVKPQPVDDDDAPPLSKQEQKKKKEKEKQLKFDNFINLASQCRKAAAMCAYSYNIAQILEDMVSDGLLRQHHHHDAYQALITDKSFDYRDVPLTSQGQAQTFVASLSKTRNLLAAYKRDANWGSYYKLSHELNHLATHYAHLKSSLSHGSVNGRTIPVPSSIMIDEEPLQLEHPTMPPPPRALELPVLAQPYSLSPTEPPAPGQHVAWAPPQNAAPVVSHASAASLFGTLQMPPSDEWKGKRVEVSSSNGSTTIELSRWGFCPWCRAPVDNSWPICPAAGCGRPIVRENLQPLSAQSSSTPSPLSLETEKSWFSNLPSLKLPPLPFFGGEPPEEGVTLSV